VERITTIALREQRTVITTIRFTPLSLQTAQRSRAGLLALEPTQTGRKGKDPSFKNQCSDTNAGIGICEVDN
jgi:hypothetical protein